MRREVLFLLSYRRGATPPGRCRSCYLPPSLYEVSAAASSYRSMLALTT